MFDVDGELDVDGALVGAFDAEGAFDVEGALVVPLPFELDLLFGLFFPLLLPLCIVDA